MKRDLDLIRDILMRIECSDNRRMYIEDFESDTNPAAVISYHLHLLLDSDFIEADVARFGGQDYDQFVVNRMTMSGHDYLDSIRDKSIWDETKKRLSVVGSSASLEIVRSVAAKIILDLLKI